MPASLPDRRSETDCCVQPVMLFEVLGESTYVETIPVGSSIRGITRLRRLYGAGCVGRESRRGESNEQIVVTSSHGSRGNLPLHGFVQSG